MLLEEVKRLVKHHSISELNEAEDALFAEKEVPFKIEGDSDGEQLQHVMATIWVIDRMNSNDLTVEEAFKQYQENNRPSID
jgi:hypothetical protein